MNSRVNKKSLTIEEIIELISQFDETVSESANNQNLDLSERITDLKSLNQATKSDLSFCSNTQFLTQLNQSKAGLVLISEQIKSQYQLKFNDKIKSNWLICKDPRLSFDSLCPHYYPAKSPNIHPSAVIDQSAKIGKNAFIAPGVVIGKEVEIGDDACIYPNVSIYDRVEIGHQVVIHSGTVIGSDGFGFALINETTHKQPQIGSVKIGNRVEIGANCAIDRGSVSDTTIADEVKIDNLVHIAHNVQIGFQTAIMGSCGIAGGAIIGKRCRIYGMVAINGHISIADEVHILGHSTVTKSISEEKTTWASTSREQPVGKWSKNAILTTRLVDLFNRIKKIENQIKN